MRRNTIPGKALDLWSSTHRADTDVFAKAYFQHPKQRRSRLAHAVVTFKPAIISCAVGSPGTVPEVAAVCTAWVI